MREATVIHVMTTAETRNPIGSVARLDMTIAVGFGSAVVTRDGKVMLDGEKFYRNARRRLADGEGWASVRHAEKLAKRTRGVWRIEIDAPLWSAKWERKSPGKWVCIEAGEGFA